jgi:hypothetical protein
MESFIEIGAVNLLVRNFGNFAGKLIDNGSDGMREVRAGFNS